MHIYPKENDKRLPEFLLTVAALDYPACINPLHVIIHIKDIFLRWPSILPNFNSPNSNAVYIWLGLGLELGLRARVGDRVKVRVRSEIRRIGLEPFPAYCSLNKGLSKHQYTRLPDCLCHGNSAQDTGTKNFTIGLTVKISSLLW